MPRNARRAQLLESALGVFVAQGYHAAAMDDIAERARTATPGGRDAQFLAVLFEQPYCRINTVAERCDVSRQTASTWLHALVTAGLLRDTKVGRERLFVNHELLDVLTRPD